MPLRIAFDMDGVLADMDGELVRHAEGLFGEAMVRRLLEGPTTDVPDTTQADDKAPESGSTPEATEAPPSLAKLHLTSRQQRRLWRHVQTVEDFWGSLAEIEPGAVARLGQVASERRWEIIFLTKRPETAGATSQ